jgi:hypothetical protein
MGINKEGYLGFLLFGLRERFLRDCVGRGVYFRVND